MGNTLARLTMHDEGEDERRRERRHLARARATLSTARGDMLDVTLIDVSTHGCAAQVGEQALRAGSFVTVALGERPGLQAIVRWLRDGAAGMEFLAPIPMDRSEWHDLMV